MLSASRSKKEGKKGAKGNGNGKAKGAKGKEKGTKGVKDDREGGGGGVPPRPRSAKQRKSLSDRLASVSAIARKASESTLPVTHLQRPPSSQSNANVKMTSPISHSTSPVSLSGVSPPVISPMTPPQPQPFTHLHQPHPPSQQPQPLLRLAPPNARFMECSADDLRLSEIGELLREYRRVVEGVRSVGGFEGQ
ncbi:hypothetical protein CVT24_008108 [Panaeolus cyanescens]|uniref:Uncharacterized protein n=1 Tax=Panaeolus cyanescens TaxID=181874 RepID=A0A409YLK5_9AGAR|nr:hypothetical protein CVT24_008108 [Panaeolus cyanescens]